MTSTATISDTTPGTHAGTDAGTDPRQLAKVRRTIHTKSFATLATTSPAGRPHVAGVVYDEVDGELWVHTMRTSRKARSIAANPHVAVCIPFRKLPAGPPYSVHFQATARLVAMDSREALDRLEAGKLTSISGHGALDEPDGVFVRIVPNDTVHSYGLGANPIDLIRDPLHSGARSVSLAGADDASDDQPHAAMAD